MTTPVIEQARAGDIEAVRGLFLEYARSLDFSLCFQGFDEELAALPGDYAPPLGRLLVARAGAAVVGCVGLRPLESGVAEIKRLYVQPAWRSHALGRRLAEAVVAAAREAGHHQAVLDTIGDTMKRAQALYVSLGFTPIPAYYENPHPAVVYYGLELGKDA